jgi:hypothetical protein
MENFPFHMFHVTEHHGRSATIILIHKYLLKEPQVMSDPIMMSPYI